MTFVSLEFVFFLAIVFLTYFLCPKNKRWIILLIASMAFYYICSKKLILVLIASTAVTFLTGLGVGRVYDRRDEGIRALGDQVTSKDKKARKAEAKKQAKKVMLVGVLIELGVLIFIKYFNFIGETINSVAGASIPRLNLLMPLGISFYTLQAISYIMDVYREKMKPDHHFFKFALYMSFFPQIVQGPFPRYRQLAEQLYTGHDFDYQRFMFGIQLILWGWMKKLIIADRVSIPVSQIFNNYELYHGQMIFLGAALYGLQVYADFSGGMDIARGVSQVLGIELELNFRQPYFSTSVEDFWRRWHITLGAFMRDYVFYPMSLSKLFNDLSKKARKVFGNNFGKKLPSFLAMFIVYFIVGAWHGSSWKYVAYGVYNGMFIV
ncbi:MAG: MBOAT family protein, partial [Firmicutes bacterium]|nr:MBOAT family protein [Bacillota bacterium]